MPVDGPGGAGGSERSVLLRDIGQAFQRIGRFVARRALPRGVSLPQYIVLRELGKAPLRPSDLAARLGVTPATVTTLVDRMIEAGLLVRGRDAGDRRIVRLSLTERGRRRLAEIEALHARVWERLFSDLDEPELERLQELLDKVTRTAARLEGNPASTGD